MTKLYAVGDVVYTDNNMQVALKCTTAGTTSNTELDISNVSVGKSVEDGSVVWKAISRSNVLDENGVVSIANGGTGANTEESARKNLGVNIKIYKSIYDMGLLKNNTLIDVAKKLLNNEMLAMYISSDLYASFGLPTPGIVTAYKSSNVMQVTLLSKGSSTGRDSLYTANVRTDFTDVSEIVWSKLATNGALSMPNLADKYIQVTTPSFNQNQSATQSLFDIYIAPCDGWMKITVWSEGDRHHAFGAWVSGDVSFRYVWGYGDKVEGFLPMCKGASINCEFSNISQVTFKFIYAQSEV